MPGNWHKIRTAYVTGDISLRALAKKFNVGLRDVAEHSKKEEWVRLREEYRDKAATRAQQKILEKTTDLEAEHAEKIQNIISQMLVSVEKAASELGILELHQKKQIKKSEDKGSGVREEQTITKEYLERTESTIDMARVQNITLALKNILEIEATIGGKNTENDSLENLIEAIKGIDK